MEDSKDLKNELDVLKAKDEPLDGVLDVTNSILVILGAEHDLTWRRAQSLLKDVNRFIEDLKHVKSVIDDACRPPPGLKWMEVGSAQPVTGAEINNQALATALEQKVEFCVEDLQGFKVDKLSYDSYIRVGNTYFIPAEPLSWSATGREKRQDLDAKLPYKRWAP